MADETIVNKLGFSVDDALQALKRLDDALGASGTAFQTFGSVLDNWNGQAGAALTTMKEMASAAQNLSSSMTKMGSGPAMPAAQGPAASGVWLPPGMEAEAKRLDDVLRSVGTTATETGGKIKDAGTKGKEGIDDADKSGEKFTVTWGTLTRVVTTQLIVRAMSQIRDALREAVTESIEFQRRIAEIRAISPQIGGDFTQLSSEAAEFAKQFNLPLRESTEGLYQTISNQFTGIAEMRLNVMSASMKLAKVGVMDFHDAILLITGTLNAYGMTSDQADTVAAKFFTTIRLGRVRGQELADTMGQVIPIAAELGVGLDEINAAMVALTIGGLDAHKSVTGLRGAMIALLKPSTDMQKVIRELGFTSAEQLIQAKGLQGALQAVADASDNMASVIGKSVRNVRALTAELRLTQTGTKQVEEAMKAMAVSTPDMLDTVYKKFISTDSEKLTREINRLKINLVEDFGNSLTGVLATIVQFVGGADRLSAGIQAIAFAAIPAAVALLGLAGAAVVTHLAFGPIGWTMLAVTAALSLFAGGVTYTTAQSINETRRLSNEQRQATLEYLKNKEEELRALRETEEKKMAEENRAWENRAAVVRRSYFKALDELRDKNKEIIDSDRQTMQSMIGSQERVVAAYRNAAQAAARIVQESQNRRMNLEGQYADVLFKERVESDLRLSGAQKADAIFRRSWELEAQANKALAGAQTEADVQRAAVISQRAESYLKEGTVLAKESGDTWLQYQAHLSIQRNLEQRIAAEKKLSELQATRAQSLADEAANEQQRLDQMKALMKAILVDLQAFDKNGAKSPAALADQQARLTKNIDKFRDLWMGGQKVDVADLLAFDQLQRRVTLALEGGVSQAEVNSLYAAPETFAKFRADIEKGVGPVRVMIDAGRFVGSQQMREATKGMTAEETMAHFSSELQRSTQIIGSYNATQDALKVANSALESSQGEITAALDRWATVGWFNDLKRFGGLWEVFNNRLRNFTSVKEAVTQLDEAISKFNAPGAKPSTEDVDLLKAAYDKYLEAVRPSAKSKAALDEFMKKANMAADAAKRVQTLETGLKAMESNVNEAMQNRPAIEDALKAAEDAAGAAKEGTEGVQTGADGAKKALTDVSQINMGGLVSQAEALADAMWSAATASQMVQPAAPEMTAAHGGVAWKFLAPGGPVGTDVVPAMLSPGEMVINAASARKFAAQLTAINAGVQPVYRSEGGSVTNIGDINVTVSGGGTGRQTAREIATELRRELRRGTSVL